MQSSEHAYCLNEDDRKRIVESCPKCKAKIGLHRYESRTHVHLAQGAACCVCGYWLERCTRAEEKTGRRAGKKVKRR